MHHLLKHINQDITKRQSKDKDSTVNKTEYRSKMYNYLCTCFLLIHGSKHVNYFYNNCMFCLSTGISVSVEMEIIEWVVKIFKIKILDRILACVNKRIKCRQES